MDAGTLFAGLVCFGGPLGLIAIVGVIWSLVAAGLWLPTARGRGLAVKMMLPWRRQRLEGVLGRLPGAAALLAEILQHLPFGTMEDTRLLLCLEASPWDKVALEALLTEAHRVATAIRGG